MDKLLEGYELHNDDYKLVFEDHFDGDDLDPNIWTKVSMREKGHDDTFAVRSTERKNLRVEDSNLVINGLWEGKEYTSAMVNTKNSLGVLYGYIEIRAKLPKGGRGVWPGFWTRSAFEDAPAINEIDFFEMFSTDEKIVHSVHSWWRDIPKGPYTHISFLDHNNYGNIYYAPEGTKVSDDYMTIGAEWTPELIAFMVNGKRIGEFSINDPVHVAQHYPVHLIISMALGLPFLGKPDETTPWPVEYKIDYLRIFQNKDGKLFDLHKEK